MARKPFTPKPGGRGDTITIHGREFQVWAPTPGRQTAWLVPTDPIPGDPPLYYADLRFPEVTLSPRTIWGDRYQPEAVAA